MEIARKWNGVPVYPLAGRILIKAATFRVQEGIVVDRKLSAVVTKFEESSAFRFHNVRIHGVVHSHDDEMVES
jgi:hypothetical protein